MKNSKSFIVGLVILIFMASISSCVYHTHRPDYGYRHRPHRVIVRPVPPRVVHRHYDKRDYRKYEKRYNKRHQSRYGYRNGPR